ncbi:MAG: DMT family transporter [Anaerolineales bacterium]|nr:DMT family transporter [Anaerolineales bacterium]
MIIRHMGSRLRLLLTVRQRGLLLAVLAAACWGTSGLFVNVILGGGGLSAWALAFWRAVFTFLTLLLVLGWKRPSALRTARRDLPWLAGMGASMGLLHVTWNASIMTNGVPVATVMQYNAPIIVAVAAWLLWREPFTRRGVAAMALAMGGTLLMAWPAAPGAAVRGMTLPGLLVGLGTAVAYSSFTLCGKQVASRYEPWTIVLYVFGFSTLVLLPFQFAQPAPWPQPPLALAAFAALVWLTTMSGYALYTLSLRWLPAGEAVIASVSEVVFAAVLAFLLLGQALAPLQLVGAACVSGSVVLLSARIKKS